MAESDSRKTWSRKRREIAGTRFGKLLVLHEVAKKNPRSRRYLCQCDCGKETEVNVGALSSGHTRSCGCLILEAVTKHGCYRGDKATKTYRAWHGMKQRCLNQFDKSYKNYGGRCITICERWRNSFENFLADMGESPMGASIDRIDNDKGYCPENCRWATTKQQANNRRSNVVIAFEGRTQTLMQWSEELGIKHSTLKMRLRRGWSVEEIFSIQPSR